MRGDFLYQQTVVVDDFGFSRIELNSQIVNVERFVCAERFLIREGAVIPDQKIYEFRSLGELAARARARNASNSWSFCRR